MFSTLMIPLLLLGADPPAASAKAVERLQALHLAEAQTWQMYVDEAQTTKAVLIEKPIYVWTNPTRSHGQHGAVYVWLHRGRPVAVGSIFSHPEAGKRMICHEFHSLAESTLAPQRGADDQTWQPKASVPLLKLSGAEAPAASPARRLIQMRALARDFSAHSIDYQKERWDLRLLPQPLYRYDKPEGDVIDGTLFAFVTSAGTDPEVVLALEARKVGDALAWHYRAIRFSDSDLYVQHEGKDIWSSVRDDANQLHFNPDHTYRLLRDKAIDELPELADTAPQEIAMSVLLLTLLLAADPAESAAPPPKLAERLQALNLEEARKWEMFLDESHQTKAELVERPVYLWTNPLPRFGLQHGSVFLWLHEGRPMVVGSFFGHPVDAKRRKLIHEFHALSPTKLSAVCHDEQNSVWQPKAALTVQPVPGAAAPEKTPTRRLIQMRALAREFSGRTIDHRKERWELRLLSQPLYRYELDRKEQPQGEVIDGALMALVTDAGTDPEVLLLLEARQDGGWHYALLRFCDASVWVNHKDKEVWTAVRDTENVQLNNPDHTYQVFQKRHVELSEDDTGEAQP